MLNRSRVAASSSFLANAVALCRKVCHSFGCMFARRLHNPSDAESLPAARHIIRCVTLKPDPSSRTPWLHAVADASMLSDNES